VSEVGWTGGTPGEGPEEGTAKACAIGYNGPVPPEVAATAGGGLAVFATAWPEVIQFGPGGEGCPTASEAPTGLEVTLDKRPVTNPEVGGKVTLSADIIQASVLSTTWIFDDGQEATVQTPAGEQIQTAVIEHAFAKAGNLNVEAIIHTDDLATPEIRVKRTVTVVEHHEEKRPPHEVQEKQEKEEPIPEEPGEIGVRGGGAGGSGFGGAGGALLEAKEPSEAPPARKKRTAAESSPRATLTATSLGVTRSGAVVPNVICPRHVATCAGTVTLRTATSVSTRSFTIIGGRVEALTLRLSGRARALLARSRVLRAKVTVSAHDPSGGSSTVTTIVTLRAA
jgi:hypothetical protein